MKTTKFFIKVILLSMLCISSAFAYIQNKQNVLILHAYHPSFLWTGKIASGIHSVFNDSTKYNIYIEYMDTKRHSSKIHFDNLKSVYQEKYKDIKLDVIISTDDNAFNFLKKNNSSLFKGTPVVFCGVNNLNKNTPVKYKNATGVTEKLDIKTNYDLIIKLHPNTKKIYNLIDTTTTGKAIKKSMQNIIDNYENKKVKFDFIHDYTMEEFIQKLDNLEKDSVILHSAFFKTSDGKFLSNHELQDLLKKYANIPIYTTADGMLGTGFTGGYITSGHAQGEVAAKIAKIILDGIKVQDIPILYKSPNTYMFDLNEIKYFDIDQTLIPRESIILNKKVSILEIYFKEIMLTITAFVLMIIFIVILLININRRKKAEIHILKQLKFQQDLIDNVNTPIYYKNLKKEYIGCNKAFADLHILSKAQILNKTAYDITGSKGAKYFHEKDDELLEVKKLQEYEGSVVNSNGVKKDLKFYKNLFYEDGKIAGIVGAIFDITESKALNHELNRMLLSFDKNVIASKTDYDGKIIYASEAFCKISGYSKEELIGNKHSIQGKKLNSRKIYKELWETIAEKKETWRGELNNRKKDGEIYTLKIIISSEYDKNGEFLNYTAICEDITAKKQIEHAKVEIEKLNIEITDTQKEVVFRMGAIGEARSKETGMHVKRVAEYSKLLALYYGLSKEDSNILELSSPMHDIGKVAIPDSILKKPGKLTEAEFEVMKSHTTVGYEMLNTSDKAILKAAAIVAHQHQEKYNGTGYPQGLKGEDIHIYGRITAVADVFDALGSTRCYKKAWNDDEIFNLFKEEKGKHFDPKLIDIFFDNVDEFLEIRDRMKDI